MVPTDAPAQNLGETLLREGLINQDQYRRAMVEYEVSERPLSRILIDMGAITEGVRLGVLQKKLDLPVMAADQVRPKPEVLKVLNRKSCEKYRVVPLRIEDGKLIIAVEDPTDVKSLQAIEKQATMPLIPHLARVADLANTIAQMPDDTAKTVDENARGLRWFLSLIFMPLMIFVPILTFIGLLAFHREVQRYWFQELSLDPFEQGLFFLLAWSAWAIVIYWINDLIFGRHTEEEA